jgi:hypothetical protein
MDTTELDAVSRAVKYHEKNFGELNDIFGDPISGQKQQILPSVVAHSLKTGDGAIDTSGFRVIERRSHFVGKERMSKDLKGILKYPAESPLAVLGETMIRLYEVNPIDSYPLWLRRFSEKWHGIQYPFYASLLELHDLEEAEAARLFERLKFPRFDSKLREKVESIKQLDGHHFSKKDYPSLASEIERIKSTEPGERFNMAESAYQVVMMFATAESPEAAIESYEREAFIGLKYADYLMDGIISYRKGSSAFVEGFAREIEDSVRVLKGNKKSHKF